MQPPPTYHFLPREVVVPIPVDTQDEGMGNEQLVGLWVSL